MTAPGQSLDVKGSLDCSPSQHTLTLNVVRNGKPVIKGFAKLNTKTAEVKLNKNGGKCLYFIA